MAKQNDSNPEQWKSKYLEVLKELEDKERDWQDLDQVLRRGLNRVSLISVGADAKLDHLLEKLRRGLQKNFSADGLNDIIEEIGDRIKIVDEERGGLHNTLEPTAVLLQLVESLNFPHSALDGVAQFKADLDSEDALLHVDELIQSFSRLVIDAFYGSHEGEAASESIEQGKRGHWWNKMLPKDESSDSVDGQEGFPGEDSVTNREASAAVVNTELSATCVEHVFLDLLQGIVFSPELKDRVRLLQEELTAGITANDIADMTQRMINLVVDMRAVLEQEKGELEKFLLQLTGRLTELDEMVAGVETTRQASLVSGRHLDEMVKAQVSDIENTVQNAQNLSDMKGTIQSSIDTIREHLAKQREQEEERQAERELQLKNMTERLKTMEAESNALRERLAEERAQATTDALTGAPNRLAYERSIDSEYARWKRYNNMFSLAIIDVDHFKRINDSYGHKAGDRALIAIVKTVQRYLRETDFLARVGGEEFVVILANTELTAGEKVAEKLRMSIEKSDFVFHGQPVPITVSVGVTEIREGDDIDSIYVRADEALYRAKKQGRNCVVSS